MLLPAWDQTWLSDERRAEDTGTTLLSPDARTAPMMQSSSHAKGRTTRKRKLEPQLAVEHGDTCPGRMVGTGSRIAVYSASSSSVLALEVGQNVKACYQGRPRDGWFPGAVHRINEDGTVAIHYDDDDTQERVLRKHVRPSKTEAPTPSPLGRPDGKRPVFKPNWLQASELAASLYRKFGSARQGGVRGESRVPRTQKAGRKVLGGVRRDDQSLSETVCELLPQLASPSDDMLSSEPSAMAEVAEVAAGEEEEDGVEEGEEEEEEEE